MQSAPQNTQLLLTGFGPFPGVPENPTTRLVAELAARLEHRPGLDLTQSLLATEWNHVAREAPALLERTRPDIAIHFGLCRGASAIRIERSAYNATASSADAAGRGPSAPDIRPGAAHRLDTGLPAAALARHLRASGVHALPSLSAGRYLCNYLYYLSLDWAAARTPNALSLFVHIPPARSQGGYLDDDRILAGAETLVTHVLERTTACEAAA
ncbi:pyroglutamyl-peptidase I [Methyloligella sp. 2.7D]|uniref:pyroglutamyl-peptidase I n=1 Tax=unclassified Methyloligella TaxID=2625955 RepID=UPI00157E02C2|nr:pyroglutamyl-peptidase I [Methyloligella sp. GL2]QKP77082.1 pyroglutamyl-peptidase I [Methyloligella sp. GL2]